MVRPLRHYSKRAYTGIRFFKCMLCILNERLSTLYHRKAATLEAFSSYLHRSVLSRQKYSIRGIHRKSPPQPHVNAPSHPLPQAWPSSSQHLHASAEINCKHWKHIICNFLLYHLPFSTTTFYQPWSYSRALACKYPLAITLHNSSFSAITFFF